MHAVGLQARRWIGTVFVLRQAKKISLPRLDIRNQCLVIAAADLFHRNSPITVQQPQFDGREFRRPDAKPTAILAKVFCS